LLRNSMTLASPFMAVLRRAWDDGSLAILPAP
jgi:hypothetical protein